MLAGYLWTRIGRYMRPLSPLHTCVSFCHACAAHTIATILVTMQLLYIRVCEKHFEWTSRSNYKLNWTSTPYSRGIRRTRVQFGGEFLFHPHDWSDSDPLHAVFVNTEPEETVQVHYKRVGASVTCRHFFNNRSLTRSASSSSSSLLPWPSLWSSRRGHQRGHIGQLNNTDPVRLVNYRRGGGHVEMHPVWQAIHNHFYGLFEFVTWISSLVCRQVSFVPWLTSGLMLTKILICLKLT